MDSVLASGLRAPEPAAAILVSQCPCLRWHPLILRMSWPHLIFSLVRVLVPEVEKE